MTGKIALEVLVTGGGGFIGEHCVRSCQAGGWKVTSLDIRFPEWAPGDELVLGEADLPCVLDDVRSGRYAAVIHMGGISSTVATDWPELHRVNVAQPLAIAAACAAGGARFIYASSHSVYGTIAGRRAIREDEERESSACSGPLNLYARSKLLLDDEMRARWSSGLSWAGLRFTNVFGMGEERKGAMASILYQLVRQVVEGESLRLFADTLLAARDYVPVGEVGRVMVQMLETSVPSGVYNLGSGVPISFATVLQWCSEMSDSPELAISLVPNPLPDRYQYWTCADMNRLRTSLGTKEIDTDEIRAAVFALHRALLATRGVTAMS